MSATHSSSIYPGRTGGPPYCVSCGSDWPCAGSQMESSERRASRSINEKLDRIIELLEAAATQPPAAGTEGGE